VTSPPARRSSRKRNSAARSTQSRTRKRPIKKLFSDDQEDLIREYKPDKVSWDDLNVLGPIEVEKWEWKAPGFPHEVTIEEWVLPDKSDFLELSIKVNPKEAIEAGDAFGALLVEHKLDPTVIPRRSLDGRSSSSPGSTHARTASVTAARRSSRGDRGLPVTRFGVGCWIHAGSRSGVAGVLAPALDENRLPRSAARGLLLNSVKRSRPHWRRSTARALLELARAGSPLLPSP
jgi:hypothetical protein